jgi:uncharacterized OB-fold protein
MDDEAPLLERLRSHIGRRYGPVLAWDRVNESMIRHWCEALDYAFAPYLDPTTPGGISAPPTMLPVWLMPGLQRRFAPGSDMRDNREIFRALEAEGYRGIVATNCEQEYERPLRPGERIASTYEVEAVSEEKRTKFGPGFFITFLQRFLDEAGGQVGTMRIRILRFRPQPKPQPRPAPPVPAMSQDTAFFWEGLRQRKLLIQRCAGCGALRHPPGPACTACHSLAWDALEASGRGTLHSFVVMHHPQLPAFDYPHPVGLVALEEGVRLVAPLAVDDLATLAIGMTLQVVFEAAGEGDRLPRFRPVAEG